MIKQNKILYKFIFLAVFLVIGIFSAAQEQLSNQVPVFPLPAFELEQDGVKVSPPFFGASSNRSRVLDFEIVVKNDSRTDFEIQRIIAPDWIDLKMPENMVVSPGAELVIPFFVKAPEMPEGATEDKIEILSDGRRFELPVGVFLNDSWVVSPPVDMPDVNGIWSSDEDPQRENDDTCCGANIVPLHTSNYGYINPWNDQDHWKFLPDALVDFRITLVSPPGLDYSFALYGGCSGSCGRTNHFFWCSQSGTDSCTFTPPASQYYYIYVYGVSATDFDPNRAYGLSVTHNCTDQCSSGQNQCSGNYSQTCGNYDQDICFEWNSGTFCPNGCNSSTGTCNTCTNECSPSGSTRCSGAYAQTCGNYDGDACLEWNSGNFCPNGCSGGQCVNCTSHSYSACFNNDRYWYNSCGQREDLRQDCGDTTYGGYYCFNEDVYRDVTERGCLNDACFTNPYRQLMQQCGPAGCNESTNQCNSCTPHHHEGCYQDDIYWFDSCNQPEDRRQDCRFHCDYSPSSGYYCVDGCQGYFSINVKNEQGLPEANAAIFLRRMDMVDFQFAGLTDSNGRRYLPDAWPYTNSCEIFYELKAVSATGADCGVRRAFIESQNDTDWLMFRCPLVNTSNRLSVSPDPIPSQINLGQQLEMAATVRDQANSPITQALVGVIRPYNVTPLSGVSNPVGIASFLDSGPPAGVHNFQFVASKPNYRYAEAWKQVTVKPQRSFVQVMDTSRNPVWHAKIMIGNQVVGYTNSNGFLSVDVNQTTNTFRAYNTDDIDCGYKTIQVGEQANFICPEAPRLRVDVDTNSGLPFANVVVAIDGNFVDYTNAFGYVLATVSSDSHIVEIFYRLDENGTIYGQQRTVNISGANNSTSFIADQANGIEVQSGRVFWQLIGEVLSGLMAELSPVIIEHLAIYTAYETTQQIRELCDCLIEDNDDSPMMHACLAAFGNGDGSRQAEFFRLNNILMSPCQVHYFGLLLNITPIDDGLPAPERRAIGKAVSRSALKAKILKALDPAFEIVNWVKRRGQKIYDVDAHDVKYVLIENADGTFTRFYKLSNGEDLSVVSTNMLEDAAKNPSIGKIVSTRAKQGVEIKVIPDHPDYVNRMLDYAQVSLNQGFEPFQDGVHQLKKVYKRSGINTAIGGVPNAVQDTAVLKKGYYRYNPNAPPGFQHEGFGWEHITKRRGANGEIQSHAEDIQNVFNPPLQDADDAVKQKIKEAIENGVPHGENSFILDVPGRPDKKLKVTLSSTSSGSIQTAHPISWPE